MEKVERRKDARINNDTIFQYDIAQENPILPLSKVGQLVDYSPAGIRFITDTPLDKNMSLYIRLNLGSFEGDGIAWRELWEIGDESYLDVIGSVMWCLNHDGKTNKFEVGMRFARKAQ